MARGRLPRDIWEAIEAHVRDHHGRALTPEMVGASTARRSAAIATWDPGSGDEGGASFLCRECPDGFNRFYVEVDTAAASPRLLARMKEHFATEHGVEIDAGAIYHEGNKKEGTRATFIGASPARGAEMICRDCPPGRDLVVLADPPRGDARRIRHLLRTEPTLRSRARRGYTKELAEYVVAWDRGLLLDRELEEGARALRQAKPRKHGDQWLLRQRALVAAVYARQQTGETATEALTELGAMAEREPVAFLCALGEGLSALADAADEMPPSKFAAAVATYLGLKATAPLLSERTLQRYWSERPM